MTTTISAPANNRQACDVFVHCAKIRHYSYSYAVQGNAPTSAGYVVLGIGFHAVSNIKWPRRDGCLLSYLHIV